MNNYEVYKYYNSNSKLSYTPHFTLIKVAFLIIGISFLLRVGDMDMYKLGSDFMGQVISEAVEESNNNLMDAFDDLMTPIGQKGSYMRKRGRKTVIPEMTLKAAIAEYLNSDKTLVEVGKEYNLSPSTLQYHVNKTK